MAAYTAPEGEHGISKERAVEELQKRGYNVSYDKGIVKVTVTSGEIKRTVDEMKNIFKEIDYRMSYGVVAGTGTVRDSSDNLS